MIKLPEEAYAIVEGRHADPFHYLGPHQEDDRTIVRAFLPGASNVDAIDAHGATTALERLHEAGLFVGPLANGSTTYQLRARYGDNTVDLDDPYRFPPILTDFDLYLLGEGTHQRLYDKLGAHPMTLEGVKGVGFVVFAPNAQRVSLVGDFNFWDPRRHPMRVRGAGYWELFVPAATAGDHYKFAITGPQGQKLALKSDPMAFAAELRPSTASIVVDEEHIPLPRPAPADINALNKPMSVYEVHLGSWRRKGDENAWLTYRELAETLPRYARDLGFTHIEFLPVNEHPFDGSWGYQPTGMFAPTSRFGTPVDFAALVDACHAEGLAVVLDWVPGHFPDDPHGLGVFDGTALYEHANPLQGRHMDWGTLIYNYGRTEVVNFLVSNALFWLERYNIDGLRVDAVASMLYLDYSRNAGAWIPNKYGGRENLEAVDFLRRFNSEVYAKFPNAMTAAEESTAWPSVSRPVEYGGLGFGYKWNMGWMHDTLNYISQDPIYRKYHHGSILFGLQYAFSENFVLPLSHDEVVHGKKSLIGRMPGDDWQRFANLRAYYAFMFGHPGKKLMFMGCEFAQEREWNHDRSLDWHLLEQPKHVGIQSLVRDLNELYRNQPALHELDCDPAGFEWVITEDAASNVFAWLRKGANPRAQCLVVVNFSPNVYRDYKVRVPFPGKWREVLNSDAGIYGGSNVGNAGEVQTTGLVPELNLTLPPLAAIFLIPEF
ncbi:1,4-alpha-glucan branching protein GlgB [Tardiphaga sp. vice352]|uniref:1,4-alpha-glucan branching protein GlgB n=1 Tax=unclassified Tardiphaga TaxID=2631404 RepID=UPI001161F6F4|nr:MULTISPECIES: 1,4-alpha-glucan branching protein GlgB [unclassified Tardiphaga]MBC7583149.1 1,4-alpha-glucan branching protein GlgB [Tardiphaga sp.]QDM16157.1 1,4-alpha-glucan branching protein GlgB [Tardiphaga sp. vice278]QDM21184.1 1,4-alpha-glucan branching protein GlgB [Tardiphaga sp. vice154]QDM26366.1 1,4-alpha-glucan branching protein GlgB [Tardiphaga sp. vice304]QDM31434.1 1,4-alpha-glucan branching protein GlgB [Tardiphaga sp. vice352]